MNTGANEKVNNMNEKLEKEVNLFVTFNHSGSLSTLIHCFLHKLSNLVEFPAHKTTKVISFNYKPLSKKVTYCN